MTVPCDGSFPVCSGLWDPPGAAGPSVWPKVVFGPRSPGAMRFKSLRAPPLPCGHGGTSVLRSWAEGRASVLKPSRRGGVVLRPVAAALREAVADPVRISGGAKDPRQQTAAAAPRARNHRVPFVAGRRSRSCGGRSLGIHRWAALLFGNTRDCDPGSFKNAEDSISYCKSCDKGTQMHAAILPRVDPGVLAAPTQASSGLRPA